MCVYTRAREPLPAIYPVFCKFTSSSCNTYCGYQKSGRCTFGDSDEPLNLEGLKIVDERTWYLEQLASFKNQELIT